MAKVNIEFDGKIYTVDESTLASLASPLEQALIQQLAGTGAVIRFRGNDYNVDANKLTSARNVLTDHLSAVEGTDNKVVINGVEYGLSETRLQSATDTMHGTLSGMVEPEEPELPASEGLAYRLNEDGASYSVSGSGTCNDTNVIIPAWYENLPVTSIGERAFNFGIFTSVTIPDSVTSIGNGAFLDCSLTSVTIGNSVTSIGYDAFAYSGLTSVMIPDSVMSIGAYAFHHCTSLTSVTIGNSVTSISEGAFKDCTSLTDIYINKPKGSITLGEDWYPKFTTTIHWTDGSEEPNIPEQPEE